MIKKKVKKFRMTSRRKIFSSDDLYGVVADF